MRSSTNKIKLYKIITTIYNAHQVLIPCVCLYEPPIDSPLESHQIIIVSIFVLQVELFGSIPP